MSLRDKKSVKAQWAGSDGVVQQAAHGGLPDPVRWPWRSKNIFGHLVHLRPEPMKHDGVRIEGSEWQANNSRPQDLIQRYCKHHVSDGIYSMAGPDKVDPLSLEEAKARYG
jgi:hypothetical protein